jgi:hypothetical protein
MELCIAKALSNAAFERTLCPVLRANCAACHSADTRARASIHAYFALDSMLPEIPCGVPKGTMLGESEMPQWIAAVRAALPAALAVSLHEVLITSVDINGKAWSTAARSAIIGATTSN